MRLGGRGRCVYATPHNRNSNTNSKGLILGYMTWSTTQLCPHGNSYSNFLIVLLTAAWKVYTCLHACTYAHTGYPTLAKGAHAVVLFFLLPLPPLSNHAQTNEITFTQPREQTQRGLYGAVLILTHVKISAQSPLLPFMYYYSQH